ncbi:MAG: RagB/SusD family nutrient uptake outer membrane protein, partial [Gemmatimonadota bacterium]|nr:RagB/SusD family nutrient uptake outer membrane protein [Gemmatimonadota bacterium]
MTRLAFHTSMHRTNRMLNRSMRGLVAAGALILIACDSPTVPQFNNTTKEVAANDPSSLQLLATGLLAQNRGTVQGRISAFGRLGRESFTYTPTEGRNTTHFLQGPGPLDPSGFAAASFAPYNNVRDVFEFLKVVEGLKVLNGIPVTEPQKDAARGFAKTIHGQELLSIISALDTIGAVVDVREDPRELAPFVSRDSVYRRIAGLLDEAKAHLDAAGTTAFPFALHAGYAGFNTPATYSRFNRAIAAQAAVYHGSLGCGVPCYTRALTALSQSFINPTQSSINPTSTLRVGPFHPFSTATGDTQNGLFYSTSSDLVAHPSIQTDAQLRANGSRDLRLIAKTDTATPLKNATPTGAGISTRVRFRVYADRSAPI